MSSVRLLDGFISYTYVDVWGINDLESMPVGTCTTLTGWTIQGNASFGSAFFTQR
jgi:hypothetical protein